MENEIKEILKDYMSERQIELALPRLVNFISSNTVLPAVALGASNTTNARCLNGHTWTYAGSINYDLENHPCDCGAVLYHSEPCQCCGQRVVKPIDRNGC